MAPFVRKISTPRVAQALLNALVCSIGALRKSTVTTPFVVAMTICALTMPPASMPYRSPLTHSSISLPSSKRLPGRFLGNSLMALAGVSLFLDPNNNLTQYAFFQP